MKSARWALTNIFKGFSSAHHAGNQSCCTIRETQLHCMLLLPLSRFYLAGRGFTNYLADMLDIVILAKYN